MFFFFNWGLQRSIRPVWLWAWQPFSSDGGVKGMVVGKSKATERGKTRPPTTSEGKGVRLKMLSCTSPHK